VAALAAGALADSTVSVVLDPHGRPGLDWRHVKRVHQPSARCRLGSSDIAAFDTRQGRNQTFNSAGNVTAAVERID